jgi:hypothetical protein
VTENAVPEDETIIAPEKVQDDGEDIEFAAVDEFIVIHDKMLAYNIKTNPSAKIPTCNL